MAVVDRDRSRWSDDRLDDLQRQIERMIPVVDQVGVLGERMESLSGELKTHGKSVDGLRKDIADIVGKPIEEARQRAAAVRVGIISAVTGAVLTAALTFFLNGGFGH
jgi:hypothetical protein